ncbi:MAG: DNA replication/repair protein RecF [Bacteroidetes bacterium]|nr:DNA replication/repair protein RecF [Bacteroidota bacterium]
MHLKHLSIINFKNCAQADINLSKKLNCFTGNNGEGKTNLLDAIYYLSFCKSFFNPIDSQNILHDAPFFVIQGAFLNDGNEYEIHCGQKRGAKKSFKKNKKEYQRLSDHIGLIPLVMISPSDSELISEGSEFRRKFIDNVIFQFDKEYLEDLISYNKVLTQRNALLKNFSKTNSFDYSQLEVWDGQLIPLGERINKKRKKFISQFEPLFQENYQKISGGKEKVGLTYISSLNEGAFENILEAALPRDRYAEYTTSGIHKDDLEFTLNNFPIKRFASQGQQKSYLLALKLAQYYFIFETLGITPILLMDDIYDKLDETRMTQLIQTISHKDFGQVFITDTNYERMNNLFAKLHVDYSIFKVEQGAITTN